MNDNEKLLALLTEMDTAVLAMDNAISQIQGDITFLPASLIALIEDLVRSDSKINTFRDKLAECVKNTSVVACFQCDHNYGRLSEATCIAPRVRTCPSPSEPNAQWTYEYVALCTDCATDWWGVDEADKPANVPPTIIL